jgi:hypothetical protein
MKTYTNEMTGIEWVEIEVANGQFTAMTKEAYDKQAEQSTPIVIDETATK